MQRVEYDDLDFDGMDFCTWNGMPFTGVAYELWPDGSPRAEQHYQEGREHGPGMEWYADGKRAESGEYRFGSGHGIQRKWWPNGMLKSQVTARFGQEVARKEWDERGTLTHESTLDPDSAAYKRLLEIEAREGEAWT